MSNRIVIDTSVFVSALIGPNGPSRELIRRCLQGHYQPLMGNALFCEYEAVSKRQNIIARCPLTSDEINALQQALMSVSQWTFIYYTWRPNLRDEADNHLIELAIAGNAALIATNNLKDFRNAELLFPALTIAKPEEILRETVMATLTIQLPDEKHEKLQAFAQSKGISIDKLMEELSTTAIAEFDTFTRFKAMSAAGDVQIGLQLLDKLDGEK